MKKALFILLIGLVGLCFGADKVPPRFYENQATLQKAMDDTWPDFTQPWIIAGLIETESCASKAKCWNPRAELKTDLEYGFGLGQLTIAKNSRGETRMDAFKDVTTRFSSLSSWKFSDRYNPYFQIKTIVLMNKDGLSRLSKCFTDSTSLIAGMLAGYNGGIGAVVKDRQLCRFQAKDPSICNRWYGGVADYSSKSRKPIKIYGNRSFFDINREYPIKVSRNARKYVGLVK